MTVYGIFGDHDASPKLVRAALDDYFDTWLNIDDANDEGFALLVGVRKALPIYGTIGKWAERVGCHVTVFTPLPEEDIQSLFGVLGYDVYNRSDRFMLDVVDNVYASDEPNQILVLLGPQEPPTDVARAIMRALDSGMEVRDLSEGGITYVRAADNPLPTPNKEKTITMAAETMTLEEVGALADEGNEDAVAALAEYAEAHDVDVDDHSDKTWAEFAEFLAGLDEDDEDESDEDPDDDDEADTPAKGGGYTEEELEAMETAELRLLGKNHGVPDAHKARRATIIRGILDGVEGGSDEPEDKPAPRKAAATADDDVLEALGTIARWIKSL